MNREQMELTLEHRSMPASTPASAPARRGQRRRGRRFGVARWWFAQMREAVRTARDWEQNPWGPTEQIRLPLTSPPTRHLRARSNAQPLAAI